LSGRFSDSLSFENGIVSGGSVLAKNTIGKVFVIIFKSGATVVAGRNAGLLCGWGIKINWTCQVFNDQLDNFHIRAHRGGRLC